MKCMLVYILLGLQLSIYFSLPSSSFLLFREFNFGRRLSIPYSRIHTVCVPFFYLPLPLCPYFDLFFRSKAFIMSTSAGDLELMERRCFKRWRRSQSTDKLPFEEIFRSLPLPFESIREKKGKKKRKAFHKDVSTVHNATCLFIRRITHASSANC